MRLRPPWRRRADPRGLPDGLWADDFARVDRACRRFAQVAGGRADLEVVRATLGEVRAAAWETCLAAAARGSRSGVEEVPREDDLAALHRALSRAAGRCAQAAEAVVLGGHDGGAAAARRAADQALVLLRPTSE
ncbi:MAG: hypothetical protein ACFCVF_01745 [Kineosporiaceae bacterium]